MMIFLSSVNIVESLPKLWARPIKIQERYLAELARKATMLKIIYARHGRDKHLRT